MPVDPAHEKAGHRGHLVHRQPLGGPGFQALQIGFRHLPAARQAEQQGHVDVDPFADEAPDGWQAFLSAGHLDQDIGPVQGGPQAAGFPDRALGVPRQVRVDLQAHVAVGAAGPPVGREEHVGGAPDIILAQCFIDGLDRLTPTGHGPDGLVIAVAFADSLLENGRIRGHPEQAVLLDHGEQFSALDQVAPDVVQPYGLVKLSQSLQGIGVHRPPSVRSSASGWCAENGSMGWHPWPEAILAKRICCIIHAVNLQPLLTAFA